MYIDRIITASVSSSTTVITPDLKKSDIPQCRFFIGSLFVFDFGIRCLHCFLTVIEQ